MHNNDRQFFINISLISLSSPDSAAFSSSSNARRSLQCRIIETTTSLNDDQRQRGRTKKNQSKLNKQSDKSFSFLSADEIEKLKQENEKKIATITRETKKKFASSTAASDNVNNNDQFDINENEDEFYHNKNLIISQHELDEDEDEDADVR
jgi:hypothetical protein